MALKYYRFVKFMICVCIGFVVYDSRSSLYSNQNMTIFHQDQTVRFSITHHKDHIHTYYNTNDSDPDVMLYTYQIEISGTNKTGEPIRIPRDFYQEKLRGHTPEYLKLTEHNARNHVFATAATASYFSPAKIAIASIQKNFPNHTIYFYDLGLTRGDLQQLESYCNVIVRKFKFDSYPEHVESFMRNFAWKAILIWELLQEHQGVFYVDSSVRFKIPYSSRHYREAITTGGFLFNSYTGHSTLSVTHPDLFTFFPTNMTAMKVLKQYEGGDILMYRTKAVYNHVLIPLLMCALDKRCIQPTSIISCTPKSAKNESDVAHHCHRFDQSTMNVLVQNVVGYRNTIRALPYVVQVNRYGIGDVNPDYPNICPAPENVAQNY